MGIHENPAITYVWQIRQDPALTPTGGGGMGPVYLTLHDIDRYIERMGVEIDPFFIRCLIMADRAAIAEVAHSRKEGNDG